MSRLPADASSDQGAAPPAAPDVVRARALGDGKLALEFADGRGGTFDASPYFDYPAFAALKNPAYFKSVFVEYGTVCWPGGEDFAPETLSARSTF